MSLLLCLLSFASAQQISRDVEKGGGEWAFDITWKDSAGQRHRAQFALPGDEVRADLDEPLRLKKKAYNEDVAKRVNQWGRSVKGTKVKATGSAGGVALKVSGDDVRKVMKDAEEQLEKAQAAELEERGFTTLDGAIVPDHTRHAREYADDLRPLVDALGVTKDPRVFGDKALSFVQAIPYEKASLKRDRYRRPLSIVGRNRGDCDSKAVLFLALMHEAYPDLDLGIVYIKGHAYAAIGVAAEKGDDTRRSGGITWVLAEPVGPAMHPLGEISGRSKRKSRFGRAEIVAL